MSCKCIAVTESGEIVVIEGDDMGSIKESMRGSEKFNELVCFALFQEGRVEVASANPHFSPEKYLNKALENLESGRD